ncbi:hypothetical protein ACFL6C_04050 [Myxococcota bacterium]
MAGEAMQADDVFNLVKESNGKLLKQLLDSLEASISSDRQFKALRKIVLNRYNEHERDLHDRIHRGFRKT